MAKLFVGAAAGDSGAVENYTGYSEIGNGDRLYWSEEANGGARYITQAGTFSYFSFYVSYNDLTGTTTVRTRKNGAFSNVSISVPAGRAGTFYSPTETETVSVADTIGIQTATGTGIGTSVIYVSWSAIFTPSSGLGETMLHSGGPYVTRAQGDTSYYTPAAIGSLTETSVQTQVQFSATHKKLTVLVLNNSVAASSTFSSRKNTAAGSMSCTIPSTTTGQFRDLVNTDSLSPGDYFGSRIVVGASTPGETMQLAMDTVLALDNGKSWCIHGSSASRATGGNYYYPSVGNFDAIGDTEERYANMCTSFPYKVSDVYVRALANSTNGNSTYVSRLYDDPNFPQNGNISVTILASTTGYFSDVSHSDIVRPQQFYNFKLSVGGSSGTLQLVQKMCQIEVLDFESSGVTTYYPSLRIRNS